MEEAQLIAEAIKTAGWVVFVALAGIVFVLSILTGAIIGVWGASD